MPEFESEAKLCEAFTAAAAGSGWKVYPEQDGWDMLAMRGGVQVGIQAKLKANLKVLLQATPSAAGTRYVTKRPEPKTGPHYRMVLVGGFSGERATLHAEEFLALAQSLRIIVACPPTVSTDKRPVDTGSWIDGRRYPALNLIRYRNRPPYGAAVDWKWYRWHPESLVWTPPFVPNLPAGVPSPSSVTPWLLCALELERLCATKGWVSVGDVREVQRRVGGSFNPSTMLSRWFECTGERAGLERGHKWVFHSHFKRCSVENPIIARQMGMEAP